MCAQSSDIEVYYCAVATLSQKKEMKKKKRMSSSDVLQQAGGEEGKDGGVAFCAREENRI